MQYVKKTLLLLVIIATVFSWKNLPSFLYNQKEYQYRSTYNQLYKEIQEVYELVDKRVETVSKGVETPDPAISIGHEIDAKVERVQGYLKEARQIVDSQKSIRFLPEKYQEYHQLKVKALDTYQAYLNHFQTKNYK